jgi:predicted metal-binding membrane protein
MTALVRRAPAAVYLAIALAWSVAVGAQAVGATELVHHDELIEGSLHPAAALGLFLVAWQLMTAAMMLPSSMPMIRLYWSTAHSQERPEAALALLGDLALHTVVDRWEWIGARPHLISGVVLIGAGAFQFTKLKDKCLEECRHPGIYLMRHYKRGVAEAFRLGRGHGLFCLGCCWALMLLMFAAGMANLTWMAALAVLMAYEKIGRLGRDITAPAGIALVGVGLVVLVFAVPLGVS